MTLLRKTRIYNKSEKGLISKYIAPKPKIKLGKILGQIDYLTSMIDVTDGLSIDLNRLLISKNGKEFKINNTEKTILEKMINAPGETFSRESIGKLIEIDKERSVDVIITRLRKKIEIDPKNPKYLQTIRGAGYVLWIA